MSLMRTEKNVTLIDIMWEGPFTLQQSMEKRGDSDYGVYQIYGTPARF